MTERIAHGHTCFDSKVKPPWKQTTKTTLVKACLKWALQDYAEPAGSLLTSTTQSTQWLSALCPSGSILRSKWGTGPVTAWDLQGGIMLRIWTDTCQKEIPKCTLSRAIPNYLGVNKNKDNKPAIFYSSPTKVAYPFCHLAYSKQNPAVKWQVQWWLDEQWFKSLNSPNDPIHHEPNMKMLALDDGILLITNTY